MSVAQPHDDSGTDSPTLLYLVGRADRVVRRAMNEVLAAHGVSLNQYTTLSVLAGRGGLSNAQLARRSLVSPQSMNEVLLTRRAAWAREAGALIPTTVASSKPK